MHYYNFNIKDYSFASIRMSLLEDLAFRRMLDLFYETEKPLPCETARIAKLIGMPDNHSEVREILNEFWIESDNGWVNQRADNEIKKYALKNKQQSVAGKASAKARRIKASERTFNGESTDVQPTNNQEPITNIKESGSSDEQPHPTEEIEKGFEYFWDYWKKTKKAIGKIDTSPKNQTFEKKWKPLFNKSYFAKHSITEFKKEVNDICAFVKKAHELEGFKNHENMQTGKFMTNKQWRD